MQQRNKAFWTCNEQERRNMENIKIKAYAKINLSLDVTGRRDNGYHDVRMVMQSINLYDELTIYRIPWNETEGGNDASTKNCRITIESDTTAVPLNEDNLIYKAAKLIIDECGIKDGVRIVLKKNIPVAAGMAGGSTDAAAVFKGMNSLFELGLKQESLCDMGVKIGADVPYCIMGGTALSEGIGEILTPMRAMPGCVILIVKPDISVSTGYVYTAFDSLKDKMHPDVDAMISAIEQGDIREVSKLLGNSLEGITVEEYPIIREIKQIMLGNGALGALMSGSGPTVFGLFDDKTQAEETAKILRQLSGVKDIFVTEPYNV